MVHKFKMEGKLCWVALEELQRKKKKKNANKHTPTDAWGWQHHAVGKGSRSELMGRLMELNLRDNLRLGCQNDHSETTF